MCDERVGVMVKDCYVVLGGDVMGVMFDVM